MSFNESILTSDTTTSSSSLDSNLRSETYLIDSRIELSDIDLEEIYTPKICEVLNLNERDENSRIIALHLLNNGRQALGCFQKEINRDYYESQMNKDGESQLLQLLEDYFSQIWHRFPFDWFKEYLRKKHSDPEDVNYQRVLKRTAEYGLKFMKDCPVLSIILQLMFQFEDDTMMCESEFDDVLNTFVMKGWMLGLDRSSKDADLNVVEEYKNNPKNPLFLALREYFRQPLLELFEKSNLNNEQHLFDIALDCLAEYGWEQGLKNVKFIKVIKQDKYLILIDKVKKYPIIDKSTFELQEIKNCVSDNGKIQLSTLVEAGEIVYVSQRWEEILEPIIKEFSDCNDFSRLIRSLLDPIMYLLKRHQDLTYFLKCFYSIFSKIVSQPSVNIPSVSLRLTIHVLLMKSDLLVSQIVMKLLCKQNPVPFIALSSEKLNTSLIIPDIVHIWNYSLPTILSFGIGSCPGESSLINNLFMTKFEHTVNSLYFRQTIDIDFGYNCQPRRRLNIADAHGELNKTLLQKIHRVFDGFIIQIDGSFFKQRSESLFEVLDILPEDKYCFVIVHDSNHSSQNVYQNILQKQGQNRLKNIEIIIMQKISAHNDEQYKIDIQSLRNTIFRHRLCAVSNSPDFLKGELQKLITTDAIYHLENIHKIIEPLVNELIQAGQCTDNVEKYFPVYKKFVEICSLRQKLAAVKFYEAINDDSIYSIRQSLYLLEESLHHIGKNQSGSIFDYFIDILKSTNILLVLNFLDNELRHQRNRLIPISDMAGHISIEESYKLEALWRNAITCYPYRPLDDQLLLIETYSKYIMAGYPFELIDGDNFYFASDFLLKTLSVFDNKRILVISIIGPQNSGKSTLFNNMFGTSFDIDDGRCTRGIYGCFVKLNRPDFDYILLIDSEGLLSTERADKEFDHRIVLFCLTLSHLVIINTIGEIYQPINDILTYCAETMKMIGVSRLSQPKVHFVLNRKTDLSIERNSIAIKKIMKMLTDLKLESIIDMKANMFHALPSAFKQDNMSDELEMFTVNRTEPRFMKCVQQLRETIINSGTNSISYTQEQFVDPVQWLRFAVEIFDTLQKFTDLIHFRDIHERRQHYEVRERIQMKLADLFSFDYKDNLIETIIKGNENQIEITLQNEEANISKTMNDEIENTFRYLKISEPIRKTSREFLIVEIKQMFIALKTSVIMSYEENKIKQLIHNGENDLRKLIEYTIKSGEKIIHTDRLLQFESMFNNIIGQIQRKFESLDCLRQTFYFIYTNYNIYESDFLPNYLYVYSVHFQPLEQLIEWKLVTNKVKEFIENQSIIHAYKHSRIEEQEFKSNESNLYSLTLIENLKYLNKNQLLVLFNNFDPQPTSTDKHQSFTSDSMLHQDFDRQYMNTAGNRIDDYSFRMKIRRIIINENSPTDFNQLNTDNREIFQISNCFQLLTQKILNLSHQRSVDTNLIQRIVGFLNSTIKEINLELTPFYLVTSRHFKSILHIYAILLLTKLYYEEQERHFQQTIQALGKRKQDLYEFFHVVIVDDPSNDSKCAINLARQLKQQLLDEFSTTAQRIINSKMRKYEHINRQWIQEQCDKKLLMNDRAWNIDYIKNPDRIIEEHFYEMWETIQNQINEALINQKMVYANIFLDFFKMINKILNAMTTKDEIRITFINRHFQSDLNNTLSSEEDLNNKRCCMAQVLYAYLSGHNIPTDYYALDKKYVLLSDMHTFFSKLAEQIPPSCQLMNTTKAMHLIYDSIRINNLTTFIEELLQQKDRFLNEFYQEPGNFTDLDKQNTYARLFDKVQGCQERCPSCGRPCDVDHTLIKSKPGSRGNRHCCISGHALLGMNGYCSGNTNQPLLTTCDYNDPEQEVVIGATRQNWSDFLTAHADWDFNSVKGADELTRSHGKWLTVWNKIGPELCREYRINFVPINTIHSIENHSFQGAW